jgi:hypothetical protein
MLDTEVFGMQPLHALRLQNSFGRVIYSKPIIPWIVEKYVNRVVKKDILNWDFYKSLDSRVILLNSFWGYDAASSFAPNVVMTGPLNKPAKVMMEEFEKKDKECFDWMNEAEKDNVPVIVVTLGTEVVW